MQRRSLLCSRWPAQLSCALVIIAIGSSLYHITAIHMCVGNFLLLLIRIGGGTATSHKWTRSRRDNNVGLIRNHALEWSERRLCRLLAQLKAGSWLIYVAVDVKKSECYHYQHSRSHQLRWVMLSSKSICLLVDCDEERRWYVYTVYVSHKNVPLCFRL